jgi:hypothetical protein
VKPAGRFVPNRPSDRPATSPTKKKSATRKTNSPGVDWIKPRHGHNAVAGHRARLLMLMHHDDKAREFECGAKSHIGTFSDALMTEAKAKQWNVISMKDDWKQIFPFASQ